VVVKSAGRAKGWVGGAGGGGVPPVMTSSLSQFKMSVHYEVRLSRRVIACLANATLCHCATGRKVAGAIPYETIGIVKSV
jgi:hypothetical protein